MSDSNRPYRVGMARPAQRYIEPDAIYNDMGRGRSTQIPREFPYTWNPVNGLDGLGAGNPIEDIFNAVVGAGKNVVEAGKGAAADQGKQAMLDALNSTPAGRALLDTIQQKAADGVTDVFKKQSPNLILLAVAGGAVGGALSAKLGKTGTVLALGVAGWAAMQILNAVSTPAPGAKK